MRFHIKESVHHNVELPLGIVEGLVGKGKVDLGMVQMRFSLAKEGDCDEKFVCFGSCR